jgi:hypothetical protein
MDLGSEALTQSSSELPDKRGRGDFAGLVVERGETRLVVVVRGSSSSRPKISKKKKVSYLVL